MARADRRSAQRTRPDAGQRRGLTREERSSLEAEMFFPRLRRQAKWMFLFLALVFGIGFVVFGVGSGSSGISEVLNGNFFGVGGTGADVDDARDRVKDNPKDPNLRRELATALVADGKVSQAIAELERASKLSPKNPAVLGDLADLYATRAQRLQERAQQRQAEASAVSTAAFDRPQTTDLGRALGQDPLTSALTTRATERSSRAFERMQAAYEKSIGTYKRLAAVRPDDPDLQLRLGQAAQTSGDTKTALAAYKRYLKLAPDADLAPEVQRIVKQLETPFAVSPTG